MKPQAAPLGQSGGITECQKPSQNLQSVAFVTALPVAAAVGRIFWLAGRFVGPRLGRGWADILQGGGGLVALIVFAIAAIIGMRRRAGRSAR